MKRAFTFIEVMFVVVITAIVGSIILLGVREAKELKAPIVQPPPVAVQYIQMHDGWCGRIVVLPTGERVFIVTWGGYISMVLLPPAKAEKP